MYLSTIICNGGQRGWGSWGRCLHLSSCPPCLGRSSVHLLPISYTPTWGTTGFFLLSTPTASSSKVCQLVVEGFNNPFGLVLCDSPSATCVTFLLSSVGVGLVKPLLFSPLPPSSSDPNWFTPADIKAFDIF